MKLPRLKRVSVKSDTPSDILGRIPAMDENLYPFGELCYSATVNASTLHGGTRYFINLGKSYFISEGGQTSRRYPTGAQSPFVLFQGDSDRFIRDEFGFDVERALFDGWRGKVIALYRDEDITRMGSLVREPIDEPGIIEVVTRAKSLGEELIGRSFSGSPV